MSLRPSVGSVCGQWVVTRASMRAPLGKKSKGDQAMYSVFGKKCDTYF